MTNGVCLSKRTIWLKILVWLQKRSSVSYSLMNAQLASSQCLHMHGPTSIPISFMTLVKSKINQKPSLLLSLVNMGQTQFKFTITVSTRQSSKSSWRSYGESFGPMISCWSWIICLFIRVAISKISWMNWDSFIHIHQLHHQCTMVLKK